MQLQHWLLGGWYPPWVIVHLQRYHLSDGNINLFIKFCPHGVFLEWPPSGTLIVKSRIIQKFYEQVNQRVYTGYMIVMLA